MPQEILLNALSEKLDELIKLQKKQPDNGGKIQEEEYQKEIMFLTKKIHDLNSTNQELIKAIHNDKVELIETLNSIKLNANTVKKKKKSFNINKAFKWLLFLLSMIMLFYLSIVVYETNDKETKQRITNTEKNYGK